MHELLNSPCAYCGCDNCNGIDRVDSKLGYTIGNTVPCCAICNKMKNNFTLEVFKDKISKIYKRICNDN